MKISIIIPVFNVEDYIVGALRSIYSQGLDESQFEVVVVDDGSPDNSIQKVEEFRGDYTNLVVLRQENQGVSAARNNGIKVSTGDYLAFVDPDDIVLKSALSQLISMVENHKDVDIFVARSFIGENETCKIPDALMNKEMTITEAFNRGYRRGSVWGGIYRKTLFGKDAFFPPGVVLAEDTICFNLLLMQAQRIMFCDIPMYSVSFRESSASHAYTMKKMNSYNKNMQFILNYRESHLDLTEHQRILLDYATYVSISNASHFYLNLHKYSIKELKKILEIDHVLPLNESCFTQRNKVRLLNKSFFLFFILLMIRKWFENIN